MHLQIEPIACLEDNYAYLIYRSGHTEAYLVDPSEAAPPRQALARRGLTLRGILCTHHHWDHVGGIEALAADAPGLWVAGSAHDRGRIPRQTHFITAPEGAFAPTELTLFGRVLQASLIPGHTLGAIAWAFGNASATGIDEVFTGDTLFAAGCGRLFEGTPAQMHASLQTICGLEAHTRLWFGHEYTRANLDFAHELDPETPAIAQRLEQLPARTTPTTVELEQATNPFVRAATPDELARIRAAKDTWRPRK